MSAKQDRTAPRTAADIELRHNYSKSYGEIMGIATDARKTAEVASEEARKCHAEIVKLSDSITLRVTGNEEGTAASIVLTVGEEEYSGEINLTGLVTFESLKNKGATRINGDNIVSEGVNNNDDPVRLIMHGAKLLFQVDLQGFFEDALTIKMGETSAQITAGEGMEICGRRDSYFGGLLSPTTLQGTDVHINGDRIFIDGRQCWWMSNGDGSCSLTTTDEG